MCGGTARRKTADLTEKDVKSNHLKGALCRFGEEIQTQRFNLYNINEVII